MFGPSMDRIPCTWRLPPRLVPHSRAPLEHHSPSGGWSAESRVQAHLARFTSAPLALAATRGARSRWDRARKLWRSAVSLAELDQEDPGRSALRGEWDTGSGSSLFDEQSPFSGRVQVTGCGASSGGSWRRLRFNGQTEQSVLLLDANGIPRHEALAFGYLKSLAAMGSATLRSLGVQKPWRVLLLGVGLGALPGWFRKAQAKVTAIDLDPVVLRAAQVVGQMPGAVQGLEACLKDAEADTDALRVYCCDGVEFVKAASNEVRYDLLVMDVFDGQGETPEAFLTEDFGQACASVATCCVVNLTCPVPMWEDAHHFNAPSAGKLADAFQLGFQSKAWSVRVAEGQNLILCATRYGAPPELYLANAAEELASEGLFAFDPVRRVGFRRQEW
ncbi:unnamed protein product [Durusdinium trenchii]|uniref:Spermidine synthase n=1 Tax=Durusdinium trenchii TaxID=1381693 RepID=A0ABP0JKI0_9DINO